MPEVLPATARAATAALAFLTVVPVGRRVRLDGADVARATPALPAVGGLLGAAAGVVAWLLPGAVGPVAAAVLAVGVLAVITGALHLDGLADSADGLGGRTVDDRLRIMRDHTVGTYGAVALTLVLLLETSAAASLAGRVDVVAAWAAAGALSRAAGPALAAALPYAQRTGGSGAVLHGAGAARRAAAAGAVAIGLALAVLWSRSPAAIVAALAATVVVAAAVALSARRLLGGVTGDVLGAATELVEVAVLLAVSGVLR